MTTTSKKTQRTLRDIEDAGKTMKSLFDEVRVQAHLAAMELKGDAGPYLAEVGAASRSAARDLLKRGRQLKLQLKQLRAAHRA